MSTCVSPRWGIAFATSPRKCVSSSSTCTSASSTETGSAPRARSAPRDTVASAAPAARWRIKAARRAAIAAQQREKEKQDHARRIASLTQQLGEEREKNTRLTVGASAVGSESDGNGGDDEDEIVEVVEIDQAHESQVMRRLLELQFPERLVSDYALEEMIKTTVELYMGSSALDFTHETRLEAEKTDAVEAAKRGIARLHKVPPALHDRIRILPFDMTPVHEFDGVALVGKNISHRDKAFIPVPYKATKPSRKFTSSADVSRLPAHQQSYEIVDVYEIPAFASVKPQRKELFEGLIKAYYEKKYDGEVVEVDDAGV